MVAQLWHQINSIIGRPAHPISQCSDDLSLPLDSINDFFQNVAITDHHKSSGNFNVPILIVQVMFFNFVSYLLILVSYLLMLSYHI